MKIPRDYTAAELQRALKRLDYVFDRQTGSHITVTTQQNGEHDTTCPSHRPIKAGAPHDTLESVAWHHKMSVEDPLRVLGL